MLGIVGYGNLGKAVAKAARDALGMRVLVAERPGTKPGREADTHSTIGPVRVTLDELLRITGHSSALPEPDQLGQEAPRRGTSRHRRPWQATNKRRRNFQARSGNENGPNQDADGTPVIVPTELPQYC